MRRNGDLVGEVSDVIGRARYAAYLIRQCKVELRYSDRLSQDARYIEYDLLIGQSKVESVPLRF